MDLENTDFISELELGSLQQVWTNKLLCNLGRLSLYIEPWSTGLGVRKNEYLQSKYQVNCDNEAILVKSTCFAYLFCFFTFLFCFYQSWGMHHQVAYVLSPFISVTDLIVQTEFHSNQIIFYLFFCFCLTAPELKGNSYSFLTITCFVF